MQRQLTPKQSRFIEEYLVDSNATQAAIRAGYSERTAKQIATENLSKPIISKAIEAKQSELSERIGYTLEQLDADIMHLYKNCIIRDVPIYQCGKIVEYKMRNASVALRCLELRGKRLGAFTDKVKTEQVNYLDILLGAQPLIEEERNKRYSKKKYAEKQE